MNAVVAGENITSEVAGLVKKDASTGNGPVTNVCGWLHGYHIYVQEPKRYVESHHFCSQLSPDFRQCLIYEDATQTSRLIGVEYMITAKIFDTLPVEEKKYWHSHNFEVKSGILVMPQPTTSPLPSIAWQKMEDAQMQDLTNYYGKTYHLWQVDRGDTLPFGEPNLMGSFTKEEQVPEKLKEDLKVRDKKLGVDTEKKKERREAIVEHPESDEADIAWK